MDHNANKRSPELSGANLQARSASFGSGPLETCGRKLRQTRNMKPQALLAEQIERISDSMASFIESTEVDVLSWRPEMPSSVGTRTILEMVGECVAVNRRFAAKLAQESEDGIGQPIFVNAQDAVSQIVDSGQKFASVIGNLSDDALAADYLHAGNQMSGTFLIIGAYRNMAYHCGQINLIQMLKGDAENHRPDSWYGPPRWRA